MSELSAQRHAELEEEFYEVWHPEQGTNMQDMLVHKVIGLEADRDDYRNQYHMAEAKIMSRDALLEQLSEEQLTQDVAKAEEKNEALREAGRGLVNALPDLELEIAEEGWGVTNANVVRHWRDKLDALLTGESDETE